MTWLLDAAVGQLTRPTQHRLMDPHTGLVQWVTAEPLLVQLVLAIANSGGSTAFKSSGGTPIPISAGAMDIYQEIEKTTAERWWALHDRHHGQGRSTLAGRLRAWAMASKADEETLREAEQQICDWVGAIQRLLQPLRHREIRGNCPECGAHRIVTHYDDDGGAVSAPALALIYQADGNIDYAGCAACRYEWRGAEILELARAVGGGGGKWQKNRT